MSKAIGAFLVTASAIICAVPVSTRAEVLITPEEAKLPPANDKQTSTRGLTRGPAIEQVAPKPETKTTSPFLFKIAFEARNKVGVDIGDVKLIYLKAQPIDLTARIKGHLSPDGIVMKDAEAPPGIHMLRLDIKDKQGRTTTAIIKLSVN
jgi:hypothetical protein